MNLESINQLSANNKKQIRTSLNTLANSLTKPRTYKKLVKDYFSRYTLKNKIDPELPLGAVYEAVKFSRMPKDNSSNEYQTNLALFQQLDAFIQSDSVEAYEQNLRDLATATSVALTSPEIVSLLKEGSYKTFAEGRDDALKVVEQRLGESAQEEEKEDVKPPEPEIKTETELGETKEMALEPEPMDKTEDTPKTAEPKPKLRGKKPKITVKSVKKVKKPEPETKPESKPLPKISARVVAARPKVPKPQELEVSPAMGMGGENATPELEPIMEEPEDMDKLQAGTDAVFEKLKKDAEAKRKAAEERLGESIENIPTEDPPSSETPPSRDTPIKMRVSKPTVKEIEKDVLPTAIDLIPEERLSADDKTVQQLKDDIDYFYINFPQKLSRIKRITSNNIDVLKRFHKKIVALLRGDKVERDKEDKKMGVVIRGADYIKKALKEIILENSIDGLSAESLLVNIEGSSENLKDTAGSYEFKTSSVSGTDMAAKEPVSRFIPTTDIDEVEKTSAKYIRPIARLPTQKAVYFRPITVAKKTVATNPFLSSRQPNIRLKYSY